MSVDLPECRSRHRHSANHPVYEPLFLAIRDGLPKTRTVSGPYRTPKFIDIFNFEFRSWRQNAYMMKEER